MFNLKKYLKPCKIWRKIFKTFACEIHFLSDDLFIMFFFSYVYFICMDSVMQGKIQFRFVYPCKKSPKELVNLLYKSKYFFLN